MDVSVGQFLHNFLAQGPLFLAIKGQLSLAKSRSAPPPAYVKSYFFDFLFAKIIKNHVFRAWGRRIEFLTPKSCRNQIINEI